MVENTSNDNDPVPVAEIVRGADAHGQAAVLLVESLIHGLIARSVIGVDEAFEIIGVAVDVIEEIILDAGDATGAMEGARSVLGSMRASMAIDLPD